MGIFCGSYVKVTPNNKMSKYPVVFNNLKLAIKQNGGIRGCILSIFRTEEVKYGEHIGTDHLGNKYYENKRYLIGRSRWVKYSPQFGHDYDGSQVPAEWHRWLSYIGDEPPTVKPPVHRSWAIKHIENKTGTNDCYVPYSTTRPKIE